MSQHLALREKLLYFGEGNVNNYYSSEEYLQALEFDFHQTSCVNIAKQKFREHQYQLLLIEFDHIQNAIFEFCNFVHYQGSDNHRIWVLMKEPDIEIEKMLFEHGIDDIIVGLQAHPKALKSRIERRIFGKFTLSDNSQIRLKGDVLIDFGRREVYIDGVCRRLTGISEMLLRYFLENRHRSITREELINSYIWDNSVCPPSSSEGGKAIDMAVKRLRQLIELNPAKPQIILSVYGVGWILSKDAIL